MPNHITNIVKIDYEEVENWEERDKQIEALKERLKTPLDDEPTEFNYFDFRQIIPTPPDYFSGDLSDADRKANPNNWYDWNTKHWGTKWNAYDTGGSRTMDGWKFDTAWSHPFPVIEELSKQNPEFVFFCIYADEDIGANCGAYKMKNGLILDQYKPDSYSIEGRALATAVKQ